MMYLGDFAEDETVYIPFNTFDSNDPSASVTITNLADADIMVHKDGSATQIVTDGATVAIDFDSITGNHLITVDTSASADYSTGSDYVVRIEGTTVDGATINAWVGIFSIENRYMRGTDNANTTTPPTAAAIVNEWETQSQADPTGFHVNVLEVGGTAQTANDNGADINTLVNGVSLNAGAITNASLAGNMEIVFETDFATNYNTTRNAWATNVQDQVGTGNLPSDIIAISGDTGAADNLELMYDGTGYVDDTAPASRSQVDSIGSSSGGAIYFAIEADNTGGAIKGVTLVGSQAGTFADTEAEDGTYHAITHSGNAIDIVYQANVGATRLAIEVDFVGYLTSSNDTITVQAYDFIGADWETRRVITGQNGTGNISQSIKLLSKHTGSSGADLGLVLIRFVNTGMTAPVLNVDELLVAAVSNSNTLGFEGGAVWIDTVGGTSGTGQGVGTITIPSSNISDAITIATANNLKRFHFLPGSSETFAAAMDDYAITGHDYTLAFGGQSIAGSYISGATVSGTFTGTTAILEDCIINAITGPGLTMRRCFFNEVTITNNGTAGWYLNDCRSRVAGTGSANFDFGVAALNTGLSLRAYSGGIELENMGQAGTDNASIEGDGNITLNANCVGGTLVIRGNFDLTDNSATTTITQTARPANRFTIIEADTNELQTDWADGGRLDLIIDAIQTEVLKLTTTAHSEPTGVPAANEAPIDKLGYLFMALRNQVTVTATKKTFFDDGGAAEFEKDLSDDGTTYTETEANAI